MLYVAYTSNHSLALVFHTFCRSWHLHWPNWSHESKTSFVLRRQTATNSRVQQASLQVHAFWLHAWPLWIYASPPLQQHAWQHQHQSSQQEQQKQRQQRQSESEKHSDSRQSHACLCHNDDNCLSSTWSSFLTCVILAMLMNAALRFFHP